MKKKQSVEKYLQDMYEGRRILPNPPPSFLGKDGTKKTAKTKTKAAKLLTEDFVQDAIVKYLPLAGWSRRLRTKSGRAHGIDIQVTNDKVGRDWLIECKGDASNTAKFPNSRKENGFNSALGQIITRMHSKRKRNNKHGYKYGVGFPASWRSTVVRRLPYTVADRLNLYVFLVDADGKVEMLDWKKLKAAQSIVPV